MKRIYVLSILALSISGLIGCSNANDENQYISEDTAKSYACELMDGVFPEDLDSCELVDLGYKNKVYHIKEDLFDLLNYEIVLDAVDGKTLKVENEPINSDYIQYTNLANDSTPRKKKKDIKDKIYKEIVGSTDNDIIYIGYNEDDDLPDENPFFKAITKLNDKVYTSTYDAISGEKLTSESYDIKNIETAFGQQTNQQNELIRKNIFVQPDDVNKKPVWLLSHRCNSNYVTRHKTTSSRLFADSNRDTYNALQYHCNGVEIDLQHRKCDDTIRLCHDDILIGNSESLEEFLSIPDLNDPNFTMVYYDIKEPQFIEQIINITHSFMVKNQDGSGIWKGPHGVGVPFGQQSQEYSPRLYFIYSCAKLDNAKKYFPKVSKYLWDNEALMVDMDDDVDNVAKLFNELKFTRGGYGNGIFSGYWGSGTEDGCKSAIESRDNKESIYDFKVVGSWSTNGMDSLKTRMDWGLDIALLDYIKKERYAGRFIEESTKCRLANRNDYPFGHLYSPLDIEEGDYTFQIDETWYMFAKTDASKNISYNDFPTVFTIKKDNKIGGYKIIVKDTGLALTFEKNVRQPIGGYDFLFQTEDKNLFLQRFEFEQNDAGVFIRPLCSQNYLKYDRLMNNLFFPYYAQNVVGTPFIIKKVN